MNYPNKIYFAKWLIPYLTHITDHWSAGGYKNPSTHYHICIGADKKGKSIIMNSLPLYKPGAHVWRRNQGNIGVSMLGMYGAHELNSETGAFYAHPSTKSFAYTNKNVFFSNKGTYYPCTKHQVETMCKINAELLILAKIPKKNLHPHYYYYYLDKYGPQYYRWNVKPYWKDVLKKTNWYYDKLKKGNIEFEYVFLTD